MIHNGLTLYKTYKSESQFINFNVGVPVTRDIYICVYMSSFLPMSPFLEAK